MCATVPCMDKTPLQIVTEKWAKDGKDVTNLTEAEDKTFWEEVSAEIKKTVKVGE